MSERIKGQGLVIQEQISTRAIEALMTNYRDPQQAFLEIVDNAVDNRIEGKPITVRVRTSPDELTVSNHGGAGLGYEGLNSYFTWGHSNKEQKIGSFGVGGKAAMGFLGRGMEIVCSEDGSDKEYRVVDPSWESRPDELKQLTADERKASSNEGYFRLAIKDLKREINPHALINKLGDIYRPLLLDGSVKIIVNGKEVPPLQIKYMDEDQYKAQTAYVETRLGQRFLLKVGALAEGQKVKPGIRCYYRGRLIKDGQFFGYPTPDQMSGNARLIGEAHLDFVPVTSNKTTFIESSVQWETTTKAMRNVLAPWIDKVKELKNNQGTSIERYEKDLAKKAKKLLEHILSENQLYSVMELRGSTIGKLTSEAIAGSTNNPKEVFRSPKTSGESTQQKPTPRGETVKRWGVANEIDIVSMGLDSVRSTLSTDDTSKKTVLKINSDFPLYQVAKKINEQAQEVYMAETIAIEVCKAVTKNRPIEEYHTLLDQLLSECGKLLINRYSNKK